LQHDTKSAEEYSLNTHAKTESSTKVFRGTSYRPLPASLTIQNSEIDGLGLFAIEDISEGTYLGETHYKLGETADWVRTPLGGFVNHSETSNSEMGLVRPNVRGLTTKRDISKGEEITVFYTLY
jgi:SET domain-containing protein